MGINRSHCVTICFPGFCVFRCCVSLTSAFPCVHAPGGLSHTAVQGPDGPEHVWQHQVYYWQVSWFCICVSRYLCARSVAKRLRLCRLRQLLQTWKVCRCGGTRSPMREDEEQVVKYRCSACDPAETEQQALLALPLTGVNTTKTNLCFTIR